MSDMIRLELSGKTAEAWNRVFGKLSDIVAKAVDAIIPEEGEDVRDDLKEFTRSVAELTKSWVSAKVDRPGIENQNFLADIAVKFEEIKIKQETARKLRIENESALIDLQIKRVETALKLLGMVHQHTSIDSDGNATLLMTNQNLAVLHMDLRAMSSPDLTE